MESLNMMRKGKINHDLAIRQVNMFMPPEIREQYVKGINECRDAGPGLTDFCDKAYAAVECFYKANEHFMFP